MAGTIAAGEGDTFTGPPARAVTASPTIHGLAQARPRRDGALVVSQRLSGTGSIHADHVVIAGALSPGNSPGCIDFGGNVTFNATATVIIELAGTTPCSEHDSVRVANALTINGATLELVLLDGFAPQYGDRFDVMDWGTLAGSFATIDTTAAALVYPLVWDTAQLYLTGELVVDVLHIANGDLAPWDNPDGLIDAGDVLIAAQLATGRRLPGPLQLAHGDMNVDGVIDVADLLLIQQIVLP